MPVAVRVFDGNTVDTKTVAEQIRILSKSFGVKNVTLVGNVVGDVGWGRWLGTLAGDVVGDVSWRRWLGTEE